MLGHAACGATYAPVLQAPGNHSVRGQRRHVRHVDKGLGAIVKKGSKNDKASAATGRFLAPIGLGSKLPRGPDGACQCFVLTMLPLRECCRPMRCLPHQALECLKDRTGARRTSPSHSWQPFKGTRRKARHRGKLAASHGEQICVMTGINDTPAANQRAPARRCLRDVRRWSLRDRIDWGAVVATDKATAYVEHADIRPEGRMDRMIPRTARRAPSTASPLTKGQRGVNRRRLVHGPDAVHGDRHRQRGSTQANGTWRPVSASCRSTSCRMEGWVASAA